MTTQTSYKIQSSPNPMILVLGWSLVNLTGLGLIGLVFHNFPLPMTFPPNLTRLGSFNFGAALFGGLAFGFVPALLIGLFQRMLLRRLWPVSRWWIVSVSLGVGLMHFVSDGFENARDLSIAVALGGLAVGIVQWRLLRQHLPTARWWVLATPVSWYLGWLLSYSLLTSLRIVNPTWAITLYEYQNQHALQGLMVGVVSSLAQGTLIVWYLRSQKSVL